jgi:hypothetical protein
MKGFTTAISLERIPSAYSMMKGAAQDKEPSSAYLNAGVIARAPESLEAGWIITKSKRPSGDLQLKVFDNPRYFVEHTHHWSTCIISITASIQRISFRSYHA